MASVIEKLRSKLVELEVRLCAIKTEALELEDRGPSVTSIQRRWRPGEEDHAPYGVIETTDAVPDINPPIRSLRVLQVQFFGVKADMRECNKRLVIVCL
jgi:hypothetical protein